MGTQIPQAVGVAYKKKLDFLSGKSEEAGVSAVYFGDGAASTGDFYSACSFAATLKVPVSKWCEVLLFLILLGFDFDFTMYGVTYFTRMGKPQRVYSIISNE